MFKYILKRLLISIIILLGVSVIIYSLVRLMPNDYVDGKYSSQLQNGTITQDQIDDFKKLYGLYTPEARLEISVEGYEGVFSHDVKIAKHEAVQNVYGEENLENNGLVLDVVVGTYKNDDINDESWRLELSQNDLDEKVYSLYLLSYDEKEIVEKDENGNEVKKIVYIEKKDIKDSGTFSCNFDGEYKVTLSGSKINSAKYTVTSFGEKMGAIFGGYFRWLSNMAKGDLGNSFKYQKPVAQVIGENMWISFSIAIIATILQFLISIPLGIVSATKQYSAADYIVTIFTMIGISLPTYFFAAIAIKFFAVELGWFPPSGLISATASYPETFAGTMQKLGDMAHHLVLPIFVSVILSLGGLMRYTRTNTLEVLNADYIRTARAKGLSEKTVVYKHAFRNTLIPLATLLAGILPSLFGGMMITEQVFGIDGIGRLAYQALVEADIPFVMGYNMFLAILTVIGTLLSDIMYSIVDPRVKLGR